MIPIKKQCDMLFSIVIRQQGYCDRCEKDHNLQCAHIISRKYSATRHDPDNALCLCSGCHLWWHAEPVEATRWLETKYPGRYDIVNFRRQAVTKVDYKMTLIYLKTLLIQK